MFSEKLQFFPNFGQILSLFTLKFIKVLYYELLVVRNYQLVKRNCKNIEFLDIETSRNRLTLKIKDGPLTMQIRWPLTYFPMNSLCHKY